MIVFYFFALTSSAASQDIRVPGILRDSLEKLVGLSEKEATSLRDRNKKINELARLRTNMFTMDDQTIVDLARYHRSQKTVVSQFFQEQLEKHIIERIMRCGLYMGKIRALFAHGQDGVEGFLRSCNADGRLDDQDIACKNLILRLNNEDFASIKSHLEKTHKNERLEGRSAVK